jgi:galactoside O-acetyltransferase
MGSGTIHQPTTIICEEEFSLAESSRIDSYCLISAEGGARIQDESVIHAGSHVVGTGSFEMGPRSVITYNCVVLTSTADLAYPASSVVPKDQRRSITADVKLERETFVGSGSVVMPGVTVAEGGAIAANTYVDEDVPPWSIRYPDGSTGERPRDSERFPD